MKKVLVSIIYLCLPVLIYSQACCPVYIQFKGTIETSGFQIQKISLPSINTFKIKDVENSNNSYSDLFVSISNMKYKGLSQSLGDYCESFDLDNFILSNEYFYVIIEVLDKKGDLYLFKKKFYFNETIVKTDKPHATIEIPKISL